MWAGRVSGNGLVTDDGTDGRSGVQSLWQDDRWRGPVSPERAALKPRCRDQVQVPVAIQDFKRFGGGAVGDGADLTRFHRGEGVSGGLVLPLVKEDAPPTEGGFRSGAGVSGSLLQRG